MRKAVDFALGVAAVLLLVALYGVMQARDDVSITAPGISTHVAKVAERNSK